MYFLTFITVKNILEKQGVMNFTYDYCMKIRNSYKEY